MKPSHALCGEEVIILFCFTLNDFGPVLSDFPRSNDFVFCFTLNDLSSFVKLQPSNNFVFDFTLNDSRHFVFCFTLNDSRSVLSNVSRSNNFVFCFTLNDSSCFVKFPAPVAETKLERGRWGIITEMCFDSLFFTLLAHNEVLASFSRCQALHSTMSKHIPPSTFSFTNI